MEDNQGREAGRVERPATAPSAKRIDVTEGRRAGQRVSQMPAGIANGQNPAGSAMGSQWA